MIDAGIVGLGWWGNVLVEAVQGKSERIRFVHGVARDPASKQEIARRHGLALSPTLAAMLADPAVQAVVLATPHSLHRTEIEAVAAAGKPVFCEKPLTLTAADAVAAVGAARKAGTLLAVGHNRRFLPALGEMKRLVAVGELGELLHVEGHFSNANSSANFGPWRSDPEESPAGGMTGTGVHVLDAFVSLLGPVRSVHAQLVSRKPAPAPLDTLSTLLHFENEVTGTLSAVRATPFYWRLHLFGTQRSAEMLQEDTLVVHEGGQASPRRQTFPPVDTLRLELEAFADAIEGRAPYPIGDADMIATVAAFEAVCRSVKSGRTESVAAVP
ncbi:MAG: Gfo/Idh/MocA family oxidoreductase [Enhydrobacter sp.]|nr:Gfo/Idh/MocA family oxidoreductase [Enhydrobacter sp.]